MNVGDQPMATIIVLVCNSTGIVETIKRIACNEVLKMSSRSLFSITSENPLSASLLVMGNLLSRPPRSVCEIFEVSPVVSPAMTSVIESTEQLWRALARSPTSSRKRQALDQPTASPPPPTKKITLMRDDFPSFLAPSPSTAEQCIQPRKHKAEDEVDVSLTSPLKKIALIHPRVGFSPTKKTTPTRDDFPSSLAPPPSTAKQHTQPRKPKAKDEVDASSTSPMKKIALAHP